MSQPDPEIFQEWYNLLMAQAPDGYQPHLIRVQAGGKNPAKGLPWKDEQARLTFDDAMSWMADGGNVGCAAMPSDQLAIVDIDSDDEVVSTDTLPPGLICRSRSRRGLHGYYWADIDNTAVSGKGEIRSQGQYAVVPGSYVETDPETAPDPDSGLLGYYTVESDSPAQPVNKDSLPGWFFDKRTGPGQAGKETVHRSPVSDDYDVSDRLSYALETDDKLRELWHDVSKPPGDNTDRSKRELALAGKLSFWFENDEKQVADLMDKSGAHKWANRPDPSYRDSVLLAVDPTADYYTPAKSASPPSVAELVAQYSDEYDNPAEVPDDILAVPSSTDGGVTAQGGATETLTPVGQALKPESILVHAQVELDEGQEPADAIQKLNTAELAAYCWRVIKQNPNVHIRVRRDNATLWAYDDGIWKPDGTRQLRQAGRKLVTDECWTPQVLNHLEEQVRADIQAEVFASDMGLAPGQLACENGLLDLDAAASDDPGEDAIRPLRPTDYALQKVPHVWDPEVGYEHWADLVEEWAEDGAADILQEAAGYLLEVGSMPIHRAVLLLGSGANGKGTFLDAIRHMIGPENSTNIELQLLAQDQHERSRLYGAMANIDDDLSAQSLGHGIGMFKKLVGNDMVQARELYQPGFEFRATAKHIYAANEVPDVSSDVSADDEAFWRRWVLVEFPNHYPASQADPHLQDKITQETYQQGILNWAIKGRYRLLEQGHFTGESFDAIDKRRRWQSWGDAVARFIEKCVSYDEDAPKITTGDAHRRFSAWCRAEGITTNLGQAAFTAAMKNENVGYGTSVRIDGSVQRGYKAMRLSDEVPDLDTTPERDTDLQSF
jgi:putative DNA primase/helicase